ncbi:MAG: hypothetical protein IJE04_03565 [Bacilli bacterium]|nr:hypothetical protein [Bacilli bacterium]
MISFIKKHKNIFWLVLVFVILLVAYFIREFIASRDIYNESYLDGDDYIMTKKIYGVNEYSVINISDEQMANIYINDFKNYLYTDINYAYQLLNEEYRNLKFGSIDSFKNYINSIDSNDMDIDRYSINGDRNVFTIYTKDNKKYIFKTMSVMEYEVYLDDYTVEI